MKNILVTGGAGFIGSHICTLFLQNNYNDYLQLLIQNIQNSNENNKNKININSEYYVFIYQKLKETLLNNFKGEQENLDELLFITTEILNFADFFYIPILYEFMNQFISELIR